MRWALLALLLTWLTQVSTYCGVVQMEAMIGEIRALAETNNTSVPIVVIPVQLANCNKCMVQTEAFVQSFTTCMQSMGMSSVEIRLVAVRTVHQFNGLKRKYALDERYKPDLGGRMSQQIEKSTRSLDGAVVLLRGKLLFAATSKSFDCDEAVY